MRKLVIVCLFMVLFAVGCQYEWQETLTVPYWAGGASGTCVVQNTSGQTGWVQITAINVTANGFTYRNWVSGQSSLPGDGRYYYIPQIWSPAGSSTGWQNATGIYPGESYYKQVNHATGVDTTVSTGTRIVNGNGTLLSSTSSGCTQM